MTILEIYEVQIAIAWNPTGIEWVTHIAACLRGFAPKCFGHRWLNTWTALLDALYGRERSGINQIAEAICLMIMDERPECPVESEAIGDDLVRFDTCDDDRMEISVANQEICLRIQFKTLHRKKLIDIMTVLAIKHDQPCHPVMCDDTCVQVGRALAALLLYRAGAIEDAAITWDRD